MKSLSPYLFVTHLAVGTAACNPAVETRLDATLNDATVDDAPPVDDAALGAFIEPPPSWTAIELEAVNGTNNNLVFELGDDGTPHFAYYRNVGGTSRPVYAQMTSLGTIKEQLPATDGDDRNLGSTLHDGVPTVALIRPGNPISGGLAIYQRSAISWELSDTVIDADEVRTDNIAGLILKSSGVDLHLVMRDSWTPSWTYASRRTGWTIEAGSPMSSIQNPYDLEIQSGAKVYSQVANVSSVFEIERVGLNQWHQHLVVELPSDPCCTNRIAVQSAHDDSGVHLLIFAENYGTGLPKQFHYAFRPTGESDWTVTTIADIVGTNTAVFDMDIEVHDGVPKIFYAYSTELPIDPEGSPGKMIYGTIKNDSWEFHDILPDETPIQAT